MEGGRGGRAADGDGGIGAAGGAGGLLGSRGHLSHPHAQPRAAGVAAPVAGPLGGMRRSRAPRVGAAVGPDDSDIAGVSDAELRHPSADMHGGAAIGGAKAWKPPGWDAAAKERGWTTDAKRKRAPRTGFMGYVDAFMGPETQDRPAAEVWGMRIVGVLLLMAAYLEAKNLNWSPAGGLRRSVQPVRMPVEDSHSPASPTEQRRQE